MTLVILAGGMGSRYGGEKQLDSVGDNGEIILDYSVYDAIRAGFNRILLLIKEENYDSFRRKVGSRFEGKIKVDYAFQNLQAHMGNFSVPESRIKPWGTGHALLCCKDKLCDNFAVINADDFYGRGAFEGLASHLSSCSGNKYCMIGYRLDNTVTDNGSVSRGVCVYDHDHMLSSIVERKTIEKHGHVIEYKDGDIWKPLPADTTVSMTAFGFTPDFLQELEKGFGDFLLSNPDPLRGEYYLPTAVQAAMNNGASVKVINTNSKWFGVTYKEDKPFVVAGIRSLKDDYSNI